MSVAENLARVRAAIDAACDRADRDPSGVRLLPVSKTVGTDKIIEAYRAGMRIFGENKVQEAASKAAELADRPDLQWAMIGHLQRNKAREVAAFAAEFHALDSRRLAEALQSRLEQADRTLDVFIEVNSSGEPSKFGLPPEEVVDLAAALGELDRLRPRGLMTIAANSPDRGVVEACFVRMTELRRRLQDDPRVIGSYHELSMGMSGDFELAIAHGATTVRIGTAIFGARPPIR
ncbi:YggS family pyridoxal phosphate-dependent enzyme [Microlunatus sp. Gsoil 973]|jgi:pyridoxal phosphate enzyme (YggS family)|uniref:YggS family pyridoxal phosphate-dependent enzyme n=1 Tax=Microlunatus sp. Gsoil 973 TaxID=2672569 RepID=UPI0012B4FABE|nr:YggS family pyridoxal phosphate-dependent enzyme [Microlunatus sp. Gsoil 973]QGN31851.1 YggS family pyridoxal phosphate-dependent enzyme [Microlunatus sp. Gsoil 973]